MKNDCNCPTCPHDVWSAGEVDIDVDWCWVSQMRQRRGECCEVLLTKLVVGVTISQIFQHRVVPAQRVHMTRQCAGGHHAGSGGRARLYHGRVLATSGGSGAEDAGATDTDARRVFRHLLAQQMSQSGPDNTGPLQ